MKPKIIAVDFDGTLCQNKYPNIGAANDWVIDYIKKRKAAGDIIILWTCRTGRLLDEAIGWLHQRGIRFDYYNENAPTATDEYGANSRKIYADQYIDDKAINIRDLP